MKLPKHRSVLTLLAALIVFPTVIAAQERTVINDSAAAKMLLGRHMLSLQWISWDHFGTASVKNEAGIYSLRGEQKGRGNDLLTIEGNIVSIDSKEFRFEGTITTRISHINNGEPCVRQGDFTFRNTGKRKYWRLQEMDNPCDTATDYVDIYFR
jgi:hypothetical protein